MPHLQAEAVTVMTSVLRSAESLIPSPQRVSRGDAFVFRYANKGIREALVQKLARYISGLNAVAVLLGHGYAQEIGVILRTLDEIREDIFFLGSAEIKGSLSERHKQYLEDFYTEAVFSLSEGSLRAKRPGMTPRRKIRAHTIQTLGQGLNASQAIDAAETVSIAYSGYVHCASENIMEMFGGNPPHFHVQGMRGGPRNSALKQEAEIYTYRGLMVAIIVAKAFGDELLVKKLYEFLGNYESANGYSRNASP